jgi:methionyl-tRNA synthetase
MLKDIQQEIFMNQGGMIDTHTVFVIALIILGLIIWTFVWKIKALWHAARHDDKFWFIILFLVNTLGILEIIYLKVISKNKYDSENTKSHNNK